MGSQGLAQLDGQSPGEGEAQPGRREIACSKVGSARSLLELMEADVYSMLLAERTSISRGKVASAINVPSKSLLSWSLIFLQAASLALERSARSEDLTNSSNEEVRSGLSPEKMLLVSYSSR